MPSQASGSPDRQKVAFNVVDAVNSSTESHDQVLSFWALLPVPETRVGRQFETIWLVFDVSKRVSSKTRPPWEESALSVLQTLIFAT